MADGKKTIYSSNETIVVFKKEQQKTDNTPEPQQYNYCCDKCNDLLDGDTLYLCNTHCLNCSKYWCCSCGELKTTCQYCGHKIIQPN